MSSNPPVPTIEALAKEVAKAVGDAADCKTAVIGTLLQPGLRSKVDGLGFAHNEHVRTTDSRWSSYDAWLGKLDARIAVAEGRRLHPLLTAAFVMSAVSMACCMVLIAGCAVYVTKMVNDWHAVELMREREEARVSR